MSGDTLSYVGDRRLLDGGVEVTPYLVVALECHRPAALPERLGLASITRVDIGRGAARSCRRDGDRVRIDVADGWMSSDHCALVAAGDRWYLEDRGSKNGTFVNGARVDRMRLGDGDLIEAGSTILVFRDPPQRWFGARADLGPDQLAALPPGLRTLSPEVAVRLEGVDRVATSAVPVIVRGETGTGKELIARAIHDLSGRRGRFVAVNCGALTESLVESELFGHVKGAFSGAGEAKLGLVRAADGGTLFLDEVAELPMPSQVALLRVLQEREVRPVGSSDTVAVDLRVVCATHRDLSGRIAAGDFREDLYARLAGLTVTLSPVRERREDIGLLVAALLPRVVGQGVPDAVTFTRDAARALFAYDWPRNVRELEHALRASITLAAGDPVDVGHLPAEVTGAGPQAPDHLDPADRELYDRLVELLGRESGNVRAVARALDKAPMQIYRWARRLGIDIDRFR